MSSRSCIGILSGYNEGRRPLEDVLQLSRSYVGPAPHFLWSADDRQRHTSRRRNCHLADFCFQRFTEPKLLELFRELIKDDPETPAITRDGLSFLSVALGYAREPTCSARVLLLLAVPGATRSFGKVIHHPLHVACHNPDIHPDVIYRLIDLDPDVLVLPDLFSSVPLHAALVFQPTSPFVRRMVDARPDALLCRNVHGQTPVERALSQLTVPQGSVPVLRVLVELRPGSVIPTGHMDPPPDSLRPGETALMRACGHFPGRPDLLDAIIRAYPPALCIATRDEWHPPRLEQRGRRVGGGRLPYEGAGDGRALMPPPLSVARETLHMALAVVEYVLSASDDNCYTVAAGDPNIGSIVLGFRRHVKATLATFLPDLDLDAAGSSSLLTGYAAARAAHTRSGRTMELCQAMFHPEHVCRPLRTNGAFRDAVMGRTVVDLYRMNRLGRLDDDDDENHAASTTTTTTKGAAMHVTLLELVSNNLECIYLHVRDHWVHLLPQPRLDDIVA
jgi:hypothetical protein